MDECQLKKNILLINDWEIDFNKEMLILFNKIYKDLINETDITANKFLFKRNCDFLKRTFFKDKFKFPLKKYKKDFEKTFQTKYDKKYESLFKIDKKYFYPNQKSIKEISQIVFGNISPLSIEMTLFAFNIRKEKNPTLNDFLTSFYILQKVYNSIQNYYN